MREIIKDVYLFFRRVVLFPFLKFRITLEISLREAPTILFLRHDRLGDMVLSTVFLKAIKSKYPKARLIVVASLKNREVLENNPYVDQVLVYQGLAWFLREVRALKIDLAIDPFYTYQLKQAFLTILSGAKYRCGFEIDGREVFFNLKGPGRDASRSMLGHFIELLACLDIHQEALMPELFLRPDEIQWAKDFLSGKKITSNDLIVAIHPGGFYPSQRWPVENFAEVADRLVEKFRAKVLVFGDISEKPLLESLSAKTVGKDILIVQGETLRHVMALLSLCRLLACNNSGILHIASALKIPTVSTMGPTDPVLWGPEGKDHIVIRKDSAMRQITVSDMMAAVEIQLKKDFRG